MGELRALCPCAFRPYLGEGAIARLERQLRSLEPGEREERSVRALAGVGDRALLVVARALELAEVAEADRHVVEALRQARHVAQSLIRGNRELIERERF